ncbi:hypothetical protein GO491_01830 [Flavobacteriaceae bacterium Ap0902]|nr:hypothetical protein [Flavobacteriaceae bacterium Ap0902]
MIKSNNQIRLLDVSDISVISALGDFCIATDIDGKTHPISKSLKSIYQELNPQHFFRINRSEIIQLSAIVEISHYSKNRLVITMRGFKKKVHLRQHNFVNG